MRLVMASIGLSRTQLSTSGLQVGDLKASVTPSLHRCCVDVSVSCSCAHLQGQHDARSRPLLLRSLGPKVSEGTRHHRHALDGLPRRKPCTTAVWDESVSFPRLTTTYVWTSPAEIAGEIARCLRQGRPPALSGPRHWGRKLWVTDTMTTRVTRLTSHIDHRPALSQVLPHRLVPVSFIA